MEKKMITQHRLKIRENNAYFPYWGIAETLGRTLGGILKFNPKYITSVPGISHSLTIGLCHSHLPFLVPNYSQGWPPRPSPGGALLVWDPTRIVFYRVSSSFVLFWVQSVDLGFLLFEYNL
jgi:hypothetical protein